MQVGGAEAAMLGVYVKSLTSHKLRLRRPTMAMAISNNEGKSYSDINMTPLIDVMLVLLIIFIITIPSQTHAVKIDNPSHDQRPPTTPPEAIDLSIDFDGTLQWNKATVDRTTMQSYISQEAAKNPP